MRRALTHEWVSTGPEGESEIPLSYHWALSYGGDHQLSHD
jgi:hypothetical protein